MRVLVVGSGGREHALAWAISASPGVGKVWTAPGNPGTQEVGTNAALDPLDFSSISSFCRNESVDLVVVGPENPLSAGLADFLKERDIPVFGPVKAGARLEASKSAAKEFMVRNGLPHPEFASFERAEEAVEYIRKRQGPWVIKADGLAFGKGVIITEDFDEAVLTGRQENRNRRICRGH